MTPLSGAGSWPPVIPQGPLLAFLPRPSQTYDMLLPIPSHCWGHPPAPADIFHPSTTSSECPSPPGSLAPTYQSQSAPGTSEPETSFWLR